MMEEMAFVGRKCCELMRLEERIEACGCGHFSGFSNVFYMSTTPLMINIVPNMLPDGLPFSVCSQNTYPTR